MTAVAIHQAIDPNGTIYSITRFTEILTHNIMRSMIAGPVGECVGGHTMSEYRFYALTKDGHIGGPPALLDLADDEAAVAEAKKRLDRTPIEVWQLARRVIRVDPKKRV